MFSLPDFLNILWRGFLYMRRMHFWLRDFEFCVLHFYEVSCVLAEKKSMVFWGKVVRSDERW